MLKIAAYILILFIYWFQSCEKELELSGLKLVYTYDCHDRLEEDIKYFKIIEHLASQWKISYKTANYVYYSDTDNKYYIYKRMISLTKQLVGPIIISEEEANYIMNKPNSPRVNHLIAKRKERIHKALQFIRSIDNLPSENETEKKTDL